MDNWALIIHARIVGSILGSAFFVLLRSQDFSNADLFVRPMKVFIQCIMWLVWLCVAWIVPKLDYRLFIRFRFLEEQKSLRIRQIGEDKIWLVWIRRLVLLFTWDGIQVTKGWLYSRLFLFRFFFTGAWVTRDIFHLQRESFFEFFPNFNLHMRSMKYFGFNQIINRCSIELFAYISCQPLLFFWYCW